MRDEELKTRARRARELIIESAFRSRCAHVGSALSCTDAITYLYNDELRIDPARWEERDVFILSKGHAALALYSVLAEKGFIPMKDLESYLQEDGALPGHLDRFSSKFVEASAGSLGHGFGIALGLAHGLKRRAPGRRVFTLIGDGESQEGAVWEGALFGSKLGIDNFTVMIDCNNLQGYGCPSEICSCEPAADKWRAFGWETHEVDGHDFSALRAAVRAPHNGRPKAIITRTVKGKGVPFMENEMKWHYYIVTREFRDQALAALRGEG